MAHSKHSHIHNGRLRDRCAEPINNIKCGQCGTSMHTLADWLANDNLCPDCHSSEHIYICTRCERRFYEPVATGEHPCGSIPYFEKHSRFKFFEENVALKNSAKETDGEGFWAKLLALRRRALSNPKRLGSLFLAVSMTLAIVLKIHSRMTSAPSQSDAPADAPEAMADAGFHFSQEKYILLRDANVRTGPGKEYAIIQAYRMGEAVTIIGSHSNTKWQEVLLNGHSHFENTETTIKPSTGYIWGEFLMPMKNCHLSVSNRHWACSAASLNASR